MSKKWLWKMQYCKENRIPPAQSWAWSEAEEAYFQERRRLKGEVRRRLIIKRQRRDLATPPRPPRYDKVFFEGLKWLDSL